MPIFIFEYAEGSANQIRFNVKNFGTDAKDIYLAILSANIKSTHPVEKILTHNQWMWIGCVVDQIPTNGPLFEIRFSDVFGNSFKQVFHKELGGYRMDLPVDPLHNS